MKTRKAEKPAKSNRATTLCDAQKAYTDYKDDMLRYDIATTLCGKTSKTKTDRAKASSNIFAKHKCSEHADKLEVYDRFVYDRTNRDIDDIYSKYSKGLKKKVKNIKKNHPNYNAEDIFQCITHRLIFRSR